MSGGPRWPPAALSPSTRGRPADAGGRPQAAVPPGVRGALFDLPGGSAPALGGASSACFATFVSAADATDAAPESSIARRPATEYYRKLISAWGRVVSGAAPALAERAAPGEPDYARFRLGDSPIWLASAVLTASDLLPAFAFLPDTPEDLVWLTTHAPPPSVLRDIGAALRSSPPELAQTVDGVVANAALVAKQPLVFLSGQVGRDLAWWTTLIPLSPRGRELRAGGGRGAGECLAERPAHLAGPAYEAAFDTLSSSEAIAWFAGVVVESLVGLGVHGTLRTFLSLGVSQVLGAARQYPVAAARGAVRHFWSAFLVDLPRRLEYVIDHAVNTLDTIRALRAACFEHYDRSVVAAVALLGAAPPSFPNTPPAWGGVGRAGGGGGRRGGADGRRPSADAGDRRQRRSDGDKPRGGEGSSGGRSGGGGGSGSRDGASPGAGSPGPRDGGRQ